MGYLGVGFAIWRRCWRRTFVVGLLPWLPFIVFTALGVLGFHVGGDPAQRIDFGRNWMYLTLAYAPLADQLLALSVLRSERARRMGLAAKLLHEPRSLGWAMVCAFFVTAVLVGSSLALVLPMLVLHPFVYVTALVAGAERRNLPRAMVRAFKLSGRFRWSITWSSLALWAIRWAVTAGVLLTVEARTLDVGLALTVTTLFNVFLGGMFAATQVAFYDRMLEHHDDPAGALGKIFE